MDAKLAINILENTFKKAFDIERLEYFFTELFNDVEINTVEEKQYVKSNYKKYINHFYNLGTFRCKFNERVGLYAVELSNESSRDRARTMQRNLIAKVMGNKKEAALVAFYSKDSDDWRFSYIKKYYNFGENGVKEELSAPRRHSFLVGPNEPNHTCQKQFLKLVMYEKKISLEQIDEAFDIENVTDAFFKEYSDLVKSLVESLTNIKEKDPIVREEFDSKYIKSSDFAKKLMGQLVFMYFLQKKGWLGVQKGKPWGTGPKNFLRIIFNKCQEEGKNFYNDVLEPLFYKGFAEEVSDFHYSEFGYMVPFLNGALFEPINNYDWVKTDINLTNSIFSNVFKTFDKYNFTVKEDEPLEKEVAVDPEMLGKVFESLLEGGDRKQKGAFYTPRHIVHYMCQENLISYLETNSDIPEEDLRLFITKGYLAIEHIIQVHDAGGKLKKVPYIRESIKENSDKLDNLLKNVKVIDPAVGSGAFPVGMMNEIVTARYILRLINNVQDIDFYSLKKETIANSLYGVDLELSATDVTKLRFWLSLIVDEENVKEIEPLPNLDNQIMCGNSVIDGYDNVRLFDDELIVRSAQTKLAMTPKEQLFEKIESKKREFFNTCGPLQKEKLRREIKELKWRFIEEHLKSIGRKDLIAEIIKYKYRDDRPFFIWELEFSEIFKGENPGFDIVIGNPPYVRQEKIKEIKPYLKEHYKTYTGMADLYVYFFEKGLNVLKEKGIFAFICSNKFAKAKYGEKLRKLILENQLKLYTDLTGVKVFKEASVDTCVIQIKKDYKKDNEIFVNNDYLMKQNRLEHHLFSFNSQEVLDLREKIFNQGTLIKNLDIKINYGIKTGFNKAFIIDENLKNKLIKEDSNNKEIIKPILRGRDIHKWKIIYENLYLIYVPWNFNINKYPSIKAHLTHYKSDLEKRPEVKKNRYNWYCMSRYASDYVDLFEKEKIIYSEIVPEPRFVYDDENYYMEATGFLLSSDSINLKYLVSLLNSKLLFWYFKEIGYNLGGKGYRYKKIFIEQLPIKLSNKDNELNIIYLVNQILELNKSFVIQTNQFYQFMIKDLHILKISKKLERYYELNQKQFFNEIKKQKANFINEAYVISEFESSCKILNELNKDIDKLETELNGIIYDLYELTEKEISIVENEVK